MLRIFEFKFNKKIRGCPEIIILTHTSMKRAVDLIEKAWNKEVYDQLWLDGYKIVKIGESPIIKETKIICIQVYL